MLKALLLACAAVVHPVTMEKVVAVESGGRPYAVHVNYAGPQPTPASAADAAQIAKTFIARGISVDIGLAQVNSRNLPMLGLTVGQAFDPCTNLRAGAQILAAGYVKAAETFGVGQKALAHALSIYNTGDLNRGFANGYVAKYYAAGTVPELSVPSPVRPAGERITPPPPVNPYIADARVWWVADASERPQERGERPKPRGVP